MKQNTQSTFLILAAVWLGHFSIDFMLGIWAVYKTIAELDLAICGLIAGVCAFAGEGMQMFFGPLSDRGYRTHLIVIGILLGSCGAFLSYTENYWFLFLAMLMTCIGSGAFHPCAASLTHSISKQRQSLFMTIFQSGGGTGLAISQIVFFNCFYLLNGHTFVLAIPALCLAFTIFLNRKSLNAMTVAQVKPKHVSSFRDFGEFFYHPDLRKLYISQVCNQSIVWGTLFLLPDVLLSRGYESWICFGGGHFAFVCGMTIFLAPAGYLADRYSLKQVVLATVVLGAITFYTFLLVPFLSTAMLMGLLLAMGGCLGIVSPLTVVYGNKLVPNRAGMVSAFLMGLVWCISEGIGQFGGGMLTKLFADDAPARALGCLGLLYFIGIVAYAKLPSLMPIESREAIAE
jgi:FSR family fosmidomycin resistance protein-like MFS transporter